MLLKTDKLAVGYNRKILIDNINIEVKGGEILCLLGPNGSGKSTILKTISHHLSLVGGTVHVGSTQLSKMNDLSLARQMSVVLTQRVNPEMMDCYDVVALGRYPFTGNLGKLSEEDHEIIKDSLEMVGWWENRGRYFSDLSDGERQRVLLARAICQTPKIIVLDEPTSYLDIKHKIALLSTLSKLAVEKNLGVVLSLHEVDLASKIADRLVLIKDNNITGYGYPEDILSDEVIRDLYSIEEGNFSLLMGSIELPTTNLDPKVFVVGGGGAGSPIYRSLQRNKIPFATGVLSENDMDYLVAKGSTPYIVHSPPFEAISEQELLTAKAQIDQVDFVIDCGSDFGSQNKLNLELLLYATQKNKVLLSTRSTPLPFDGAEYFSSIGELSTRISKSL